MQKIIPIVLALVLLLSSCGSGMVDSTVTVNDSVKPDVTGFGRGIGYRYLVDNNTNVVYLEYVGTYQCSTTVMLNNDGTPVTADQIGLR